MIARNQYNCRIKYRVLEIWNCITAQHSKTYIKIFVSYKIINFIRTFPFKWYVWISSARVSELCHIQSLINIIAKKNQQGNKTNDTSMIKDRAFRSNDKYTQQNHFNLNRNQTNQTEMNYLLHKEKIKIKKNLRNS